MAQTDYDSTSSTRRSLLGLWRAIPLTAQLLALGMVVGLMWFLASRSAAERQQAAALERNAELVRLQRSEILATKLARWLSDMSRDQRAYLLTGDVIFLRSYARDSAQFDLDAARLLETANSSDVAADVDVLRRALARWRDSALAPNVALRQRAGLSAFVDGAPGARGVRLSAHLVDSAFAAQDRLERAIHGEVQVMEILVEEAATRDDLSTFLAFTGGLAVMLLLLTLLMRLVARTLNQVIDAARAIDAGRYQAVQFPDAAQAPNREMAELASSFEQLAASTEQREKQLKEDVERLTELERLKRDFVSTVSHELRTPLTSMRGALGLILGGKVGELPLRARDLLQIAMSNTERLIRLINDILDVEKMEAGETALRREPLRLRAILESTLTGIEGYARDHSVIVAITSGSVDADVVGDADRLTQVFTNLISNAVKFSPSGATVDVSLEMSDENVTVRIRDHGPGIPAEFAPRIFGKFQQAGGADQRRPGGTGLGLNIARGLVERHGGRIGFSAAEGGGTFFWVTLPGTAVGEDRTPTPTDARRAILIIEDDDSMREVLVALVEPIARPVAVPSGEDAFRVLESEPIAAIVLDLQLPGMDGFTFSKRLRQDPRLRKLPVLLFSAREFTAEELRQAGIRAADAYVKTRDSESVLFERLRRELAR